jgi:hypothetical protein
MSDKRQKNQLQMVLAFTAEGRSEAPKARREGTESFPAERACESPALSVPFPTAYFDSLGLPRLFTG